MKQPNRKNRRMTAFSRMRCPGTAVTGGLCLCLVLVAATPLHAESYPAFSQAHWQTETGKAKGKMWRGAALTVLGAASIAPTTVLTVKAVDAPKKYLPYAVFSGIATLGMIFHGAFSIGYGRYQRERAAALAARYDTPASVDAKVEQRYYLESRRKTARKMITFGAVLVLQSAVMLANAIVLTVQRHNGTAWGEIKSWPSYLLGGLLLPTGTFLIVKRLGYLGELDRLERRTTPHGAVRIHPFIGYDPDSGGYRFGLAARVCY